MADNGGMSLGRVSSGNPLFTYIDSKEYDVIINENNVPRNININLLLVHCV